MTITAEIAKSVEQTARMLGWEGSGTHTSPAYTSVLRACQRGELKATQKSGRKGSWRILPSDAIKWWNGVTR
ncbi:MAG: hypothetical protein WBA98_01970 [Gordonia sp. (in: high G+C Gram-positive bacteria)]|uniref:hypothetical protein n=1 Tax=Gordonia sp. (in: high G+C Gram-positive bacteria) TaxID=84139 RepID=UPI003C7718AB